MDIWYKQRMEAGMWQWVWEHVVLPALGTAIENIPWWAWVVLAAVLIGLAYKVYRVIGWPGLVGAGLVILTFGAYRQGWLNAVKRHDADKFVPEDKKPARPTIFNRKARPKVKRRFNAETNLWENIGGQSD